jgi:tRNA dimethylallyltransferase
MVDELSRAIKRFAKRQMTWFRREENLHWLDMSADPVAQAAALIDSFLN